MRDSTIAKNYAETLLALSRKANDPEGWGELITDVAGAVKADLRLQRFLESPRISESAKNEVLLKAFGDRVPSIFLRFLQILVLKRRQMLIPEIAVEYNALLDVAATRVHASVTVAHEPGAAEQERISAELTRVLGKRVVPHFSVNPAILGGLIVRVGDTVMDGSLRRRLNRLRWSMARTNG